MYLLATTVTMPIAVLILICLGFIALIAYFVFEIAKIKAKTTLYQYVDDFYPIIRKEMPQNTDFYLKMSDKERQQIYELN